MSFLIDLLTVRKIKRQRDSLEDTNKALRRIITDLRAENRALKNSIALSNKHTIGNKS